MRSSTRVRTLYGALALLYLLHNDLWLWSDSRRVLGLPVGLTYHLLFCLVSALLLGLLVHYAWPSDLEPGTDGS